jgi:hypothetical protein
VAKQPDLTLQEIRGALAAGHGVTIRLTGLWRFLKARRSRSKKSLHDAEQDRPNVAEARRCGDSCSGIDDVWLLRPQLALSAALLKPSVVSGTALSIPRGAANRSPSASTRTVGRSGLHDGGVGRVARA